MGCPLSIVPLPLLFSLTIRIHHLHQWQKLVDNQAQVSPADFPILRVGIECTLTQLLDKGFLHAVGLSSGQSLVLLPGTDIASESERGLSGKNSPQQQASFTVKRSGGNKSGFNVYGRKRNLS